ncbi:hypothetical protein A2V49_04535 [candidate division WWE3 bacterium RBG_19FT_COMBO_34_6]|uniref:Thymidylate kinase-like domain-containing protein n=1 Tax=candidate division WWE3 bacterium RBG_19FT_COMBO_34_6 TaxID=1802612 RepID=A0A1F4UM98_UNCKA|nr:MAG: hypothetical protein A2V49_04535 [candidate division WWE3 bacterium RBG_19FT_COMBO_34_6]
MKKIIYIIGTDGSGKTTLSNNLISHYKIKGVNATYFYARHFPFLLKPFKMLGRRTALNKTDEFKNYDGYKDKKNTFFTNHRIIAIIYGFIWAVDYLLITLLRLFPKLIRNNLIIMDRFFLDTTVNISESINLNDDQMLKLARFLGLFFPESKLNIFIKVSPQVAFSRKTDIQSIRYLEERNRRYKVFSEKYNFIEINGENRLEVVFEQAKELINNRLLSR